jgi:hypothetical protein
VESVYFLNNIFRGGILKISIFTYKRKEEFMGAKVVKITEVLWVAALAGTIAGSVWGIIFRSIFGVKAGWIVFSFVFIFVSLFIIFINGCSTNCSANKKEPRSTFGDTGRDIS